MRKTYKVLSLAFLLGFAACTNDDSTEGPNACTFNQTDMLSAYYNTSVAPAITQLKTSATALNSFIQNTSLTEGNLTEAQALFTNLQQAYQSWPVFKFHPNSENGMLYNRLNIFPTDTSAVISNNNNATADVTVLVKDQVGLPAIEFLLFGNLSNSASEIVARLNSGNSIYLKALCQNVLDLITSIETDWTDYNKVFSTTSGSAEGSPLALFSNSFVQDFEAVKNIGMKIPAGRYDRVIKPHFAEAYYSNLSIETLILHTESFITTFKNGDAIGLDDYCACLSVNRAGGARLDLDIINGLELGLNTLKTLQGKSIKDVLNNPADLDVFNQATDQLQDVTPFLKSEMIPYMGVKINYVDNDGD